MRKTKFIESHRETRLGLAGYVLLSFVWDIERFGRYVGQLNNENTHGVCFSFNSCYADLLIQWKQGAKTYHSKNKKLSR